MTKSLGEMLDADDAIKLQEAKDYLASEQHVLDTARDSNKSDVEMAQHKKNLEGMSDDERSHYE